MYNTRRGTLPNLPDYGLPDINEIYQRLPVSLKELEQTLLEITAKYEPRLERVRIRAMPVPPQEFKLSFELSASIRGGERVLFQTSFTAQGLSTVEAIGRRE
jgi:type VI secretion system protein